MAPTASLTSRAIGGHWRIKSSLQGEQRLDPEGARKYEAPATISLPCLHPFSLSLFPPPGPGCHLEAPVLWNGSALTVDTGTPPITWHEVWGHMAPVSVADAAGGKRQTRTSLRQGKRRRCQDVLPPLGAIRRQPGCALHPRVNWLPVRGDMRTALTLPRQRPQPVRLAD